MAPLFLTGNTLLTLLNVYILHRSLATLNAKLQAVEKFEKECAKHVRTNIKALVAISKLHDKITCAIDELGHKES